MIRITLNDNVFDEEFASWQEIKTLISRSSMHGMIISQNLDIRLIKSAYDYVDSLDLLNDVAAVCTCKIESHHSTTGWKTEFDGLLDFTTLKRDNKEATKTITISAYSTDFANKLLERIDIDIPYDRLIGLDDSVITPFTNEYQNLDINGIEIIDNTTLNIGESINWSENTLYPSLFTISQMIGWVATVAKTASGQVLLQAPSEDFVNERTFFKPINITGNISGTLNISIKNSGQNNNTFRLLDFKTLAGIEVAVEHTTLTGVDGLRSVSIPFDYDFDNSTRLALYIGSSGSITDIYATVSNVKVISIATATPCNFVPPLELGERILESITGQSNPLSSPIFGRTDRGYDADGKGSLLFATNGKLVRQFPVGFTSVDGEKVAQINTSFKKWFDNYDKIFCLGAGVIYEGGQYKLLVDDRRNFYQNVVIYEVDNMEAESFERVKLRDLYYSEVEVGSTYESPEEVSGLEEYMAKQKYSTPILNENKFDLVTDFITAAYPFEFSRRKVYSGTETEDYKYDNNIMLMMVYRDTDFVQHSAQNFDEINGLPNITSYINLPITPQRILRENFGWWINTGLKGYQDKYLKYNKSDINTDLDTLKVGDIENITENSNIRINSLDTPYFTGEIDMFNAPIGSATVSVLQADPYGLVKYINPLNGVVTYSYIKEVSSSLIDKSTNFELWVTTGFIEGENIRLLENGSYRLLENGGIRLLE